METHTEAEDILSSSLGALYQFMPITVADAGTTFDYVYNSSATTYPPGSNDESGEMGERGEANRKDSGPITLTLRTPDTYARNWALHASSIWTSATFMADHIDLLNIPKLLRNRERSSGASDRFEVLELGAGSGLPGLLIAQCLRRSSEEHNRSWRVTLSDYPDDILIQTLQSNVSQNGFRGDMCRVVPYAWGDDSRSLVGADVNFYEGYDLIVAADTLWNSDSHPSFLSSLYKLLRPSGTARIHLVAAFHTGRYTIHGFLKTIQSYGEERNYRNLPALITESIEEHALHPEFSKECTRIWNEERDDVDEAERRRWVVHVTLKWSGL